MQDGKPVILYVDDDQDFLDGTRSLLEANDYVMIEALSAEEGLKVYRRNPPDLILVVSHDDWSGINDDERLRRLGLVVDRIQLEGYRRVEFRAEGGRTGLAVWNKGGSMEVSN